jgi:multicomponent Na+:H+ antiporter subunit D
MLPAAVALPLVTAGGVLLCRRRPDLREGVSLAGGLVLAALLLSIWFAPDQDLRFALWTWLPNLPLVLQLEPLGLLFATLAGLLWPVTTVYSVGYMRGNRETNQTRYYVFFALAIAAAQLIALSGDLVTLFIGYELLTLSTWPLVAHTGDARARRGARIYLVLLLVTSIGLLLPAIVWTGWLAGSLEFTDGGLLGGHASTAIVTALFVLYLFGIGKAALMPFHRWLPSAMVAPTPVSALLHAVAVVKAGVFAVLKVTIYVFGIDLLDTNNTTTPMMWVAAVTLLGAGVVALTRDDLKARLAYSTVSQLAYIVLAATLATGTAAAGGALHIATHAVAKITLFFCAGAIYIAARKTRVSQLDGLGRAMPWTFGAWVVASLSLVGIPPLGGAWSKWLLLEGAVEADQAVIMVVMLAGSLLSLAYLMPVPVRAFFRPASAAHNHGEAPVAMVLPLAVSAVACVALFFGADAVIGPVSDLLEAP